MNELLLGSLRAAATLAFTPAIFVALIYGGLRHRRTRRTGWRLVRDILLGPVLFATIATLLFAAFFAWWTINYGIRAPD